MATPAFTPSGDTPAPWPDGLGHTGTGTGAWPPASPDTGGSWPLPPGAQPMPNGGYFVAVYPVAPGTYAVPGYPPAVPPAPSDPLARPYAPAPTTQALHGATPQDAPPPSAAQLHAQRGNPSLVGRHKKHATEHRDVTGGALRATVFGAMDGLVTNASLIAGATGAHASTHSTILTGLAGLVAGAFSMATGEYISVTSQNEMTGAEVEAERIELAHNPHKELAELAEAYVAKGVEPHLALEVAAQLSRDPEQALNVHAREELGVDPNDLPSPWTAAFSSFGAFTVGALTPLAPYLLGVPSFTLAIVLAGSAALGGGALVAKAAQRPALPGGIRQLALGALATSVTFLVGQLVGTQMH